MTRRRSNTIGSKIKEQETEMDSIQAQDTNQQTIKIILRRTNKISRNLDMPTQLSTRKLKEIVKREFYISEGDQILFWKGKRIDSNKARSQETLFLSSGDVINVHNKEIIGRQSAEIYFQFLNSDFVKYREIKTKINSKQTILNCFTKQFILSPKEIKNCVCVQSGRFINIVNTFEEEAIEDQSLILVLFNQINVSLLPILQEREIKLLQNKCKGIKKSSLQIIQGQETSNFKKKLKVFSCKSIILPESLELIWEEDNSDEYKNKNLKKTFYLKKSERVDRKKYKCIQVEQNESKSDTSSSEKSLNFEESNEQKNEDIFKGRNKNNFKISQLSPNRLSLSSKFQMNKRLQLNGYCSPSHSFENNMKDPEILNEDIFLPDLVANSQGK